MTYKEKVIEEIEKARKIGLPLVLDEQLYSWLYNELTLEDKMPNTEQKVEVIPQSEVDAYNKGHEDGVAQGMNDAWKLVDKIWDMNEPTRRELFGDIFVSDIIKYGTPQEALAKLKAYEDSKIEVGDVVLVHDEILGVVTYVTNQNRIYGFDTLGMIIAEIPFSDCKKTGKHLDISSILEQIGE